MACTSLNNITIQILIIIIIAINLSPNLFLKRKIKLILMSLLLYHHVQREVTKLYNKKLQVGINAGALPCARLACATSGDGMTKEPHLSPKHYKPNAIQQVLDGTRVSVCR